MAGRYYSKYGNRKTVIDGITFDSRKEANRYCELKLLEDAGKIKGLKRQVKFELIPPIKNHPRATYYIADFVYFDVQSNMQVVEDVKGMKTDIYKLKKKLMMWLNGIDILET